MIDHDLEELRSLVSPLRKEFEFYLTVSPNEALAALGRSPIRVLVAGQTLFTGSGLEVLNEAHRRSPGTARVLLVNAIERRAVEAELTAAELFYVLKRPCTAEQLKEVLHAAGRSAQVQATGAQVEHVVLESGHDSHATTGAPVTNDPITVLTTDVDLYEAIRAPRTDGTRFTSQRSSRMRLGSPRRAMRSTGHGCRTDRIGLAANHNHLHAREEALVTLRSAIASRATRSWACCLRARSTASC